MANPTLTIDSVGGNANLPPEVSAPGPWAVVGQVEITPNTLSLDAMAYQVDDGPVKAILVLPTTNPGEYTFNLDATDLPANGTYLLSVFAWDNDTPASAAATTTQVIVTGLVTTDLGSLD